LIRIPVLLFFLYVFLVSAIPPVSADGMVIVVTVTPTTPTVASFTYQTGYSGIPRQVFFDGSSSSDPRGIVIYSWTFGDGSSDYSVSPTISHLYAADGNYLVRLEVGPNAKSAASVATTQTVSVSSPVTVTVTPVCTMPSCQAGQVLTCPGQCPGGCGYVCVGGTTTKPVASFTSQLSQFQNQPLTVAFDARTSSHPNGIAWYYWTYGDGTTGTSGTARHSHKYPAAGQYTVMLRVVSNGDAQEATVTKSVSVSIPVVDFEWAPSKDPSAPLFTIDFDASASWYQEGIQKYAWTLGDLAQRTTTSPRFTYTYPSSGNYQVTLRTWSTTGHFSEVSKNIVVPGNRSVNPDDDFASCYPPFPCCPAGYLCMSMKEVNTLWGVAPGGGKNYEQYGDTICYAEPDNAAATRTCVRGPIYGNPEKDSDGDGIPDAKDNCPTVPNKEQENNDMEAVSGKGPGGVMLRNHPDRYGDACDNCPGDYNPGQENSDGDKDGDACDTCPNAPADQDSDGDCVADSSDNCPTVANEDQKEADNDGHGDKCDNCPSFASDNLNDRDVDGWGDPCDTCPDVPNGDQTDTDRDGWGDPCDNCPSVSNDQTDSDWSGFGDVCEPYLKLLFVPLNWQRTQADFDRVRDTQTKFFVDSIPLAQCAYRVSSESLDVTTQNFNSWICNGDDASSLTSILAFVNGLGMNTADYDVIVGLADTAACPYIGLSNMVDCVWVLSIEDTLTAHELGHIFGLQDEYCSNPAGSIDCRCNDGDLGWIACGSTAGDGAATGDVNWLDPNLRCDPKGRDKLCCNYDNNHICGATVDYGICCKGNDNPSGGRCIMSYAGAGYPPAFCQHCRDLLATIPQLQCHSPPLPLETRVIDIRLVISADDTVQEEYILLRDGRASVSLPEGTKYYLKILDGTGQPVSDLKFDVYFDYTGPVFDGVDYSSIRFASVPFGYRIAYADTMKKLELYHQDRLIFSKDLNFCNHDRRCDSTESHDTCPDDCPLNSPDKICLNTADGACDPDCLPGIDPDCSNPPTMTPEPTGIPMHPLAVISAIGISLALFGSRRRKG
jgi:PKD repeat protein